MSEHDQGAVEIELESDIAAARRVVREVAASIGFGVTETARIVTAASELGRNVYKYASKGTMHWRRLQDGETSGVELRFEDHGPGIADLDEARGQKTKQGPRAPSPTPRSGQ